MTTIQLEGNDSQKFMSLKVYIDINVYLNSIEKRDEEISDRFIGLKLGKLVI